MADELLKLAQGIEDYLLPAGIGAGLGALAGHRRDPVTGRRRMFRGALMGAGLGAGAKFLAPRVGAGLQSAGQAVADPVGTATKAWQGAETSPGFNVPLGMSLEHGGLGGLATNLSARGWTGKGDVLGLPTKYLPVGGKAFLTLGGLGAGHAVLKGLGGQQSLGDAGHQVGSRLGGIAGAPGMVAGQVSKEVGGGVGRRLGNTGERLLGYNSPDHPLAQQKQEEQQAYAR